MIEKRKQYLATKRDILNQFSAWLDENCITDTKIKVLNTKIIFQAELVDS